MCGDCVGVVVGEGERVSGRDEREKTFGGQKYVGEGVVVMEMGGVEVGVGVDVSVCGVGVWLVRFDCEKEG
jgi:hypothetical protein